MGSSAVALGKVSLHELCNLLNTLKQRTETDGSVKEALGIFVVYGSWNEAKGGFNPRSLVEEQIAPLATQIAENIACGFVQVDESEDSLQSCVGDNGADLCMGPCPPSVLPAVVVVAQNESMENAAAEFVRDVSTLELLQSRQNGTIAKTWLPKLRNVVKSVRSSIGSSEAIRIFVAGDRSSVGKSSVCLGILGNLLSMGYKSSSLAYIKPATQCEAHQLVQTYCEKVGIPCVPVGPVVYYKGFTRAFLAGETESSDELLAKAAEAVDELAQGKRIVMIDGVGFPAVGSICGTDNASVARACGYPNNGSRSPPSVLIVGGSGVGAAIDAFNLNATYFQSQNVSVMGAIFNKLSLDGFYSLHNCRREVTAYFDQHSSFRPFGFVPLAPGIAGDSPMDHVDSYIKTFGEHVDVKGIVEAATTLMPKNNGNNNKSTKLQETTRPAKRIKLTKRPQATMSRKDIERRAKDAGAAPSA